MFNIENRRYVGSKAKLSSWIKDNIIKNCKNCNSFFDAFAGTSVVTYNMLDTFSTFYLNDLLYSNEVIYNAFYNKEKFDIKKINNIVDTINDKSPESIHDNYVSDNYGNKFFSYNDSKKIGYAREFFKVKLDKNIISSKEFYILLASLLYSFDKIANTVGHYEAYRKKVKQEDTFKLELIKPLDLKGKKINIYREDTNKLARKIKADITFLDPPYNSRQYSRFYHVMENIVEWKKPDLFGTAMKPKEENMSDYCRNNAPDVFDDLVQNLDTKYIIVTYNNTYNSKSSSSKNKIELSQIKKSLEKRGKTKILETPYKFFNAGKSDLKDHKELLFITEVKR